MKRLIIIFVLALWLPLGVGFAAPEKYDGSQDPEAWFFDSILDENGKLLIDEYNNDISVDSIRAIGGVNYKYFDCIKTEIKSPLSPPSYQLSAFLDSLMTKPPQEFEVLENRYLTFSGCQHRFCPAQSHYFVDTVGKHIAVVAVYPTDIFSKAKDVDGGPIYDFDNYYKFMFLLPDAPEEFVQKSLEFANNIEIGTNRRPEIFAIGCNKSN